MKKYSKWEKHGLKYQAYFEDARDLYWHFQLSHGATNRLGPIPHGVREAIPYQFQCGRLSVIVTDSRGDRDLWRKSNPVLGDAQWRDIELATKNISDNIDSIALVTGAPLASMAPDAIGQQTIGGRTDDVELVKRGMAMEMHKIQYEKAEKDKAKTAVAHWGATAGFLLTGVYIPVQPYSISNYHIGDLDDLRDSWSHKYCLPEHVHLIQLIANAALFRRAKNMERGVVFLGGDIHVGALYDVIVTNPPFRAQSLVASAISQELPPKESFAAQVGRSEFFIASGIQSHNLEFVRKNNFGVTRIIFTGSKPVIQNQIVFSGVSKYKVPFVPPALPGIDI